MTTNGQAKFRGMKEFVILLSLAYACSGDVSCGNHRRSTCANCPEGNGASWCNGDCAWDRRTSTCKDPNSGAGCSMDLVNAINNHRGRNGLSRIPVDETLCKVAYYHARDTTEHPPRGNCNLHSWSRNTIGGYRWSSCCYTRDHKQSSCMWKKPKEFNRNWNSGSGFEISSGASTAQGALATWKGSSDHMDVILQRGIWKKNWKKIGAAYNGGGAHAWFAR